MKTGKIMIIVAVAIYLAAVICIVAGQQTVAYIAFILASMTFVSGWSQHKKEDRDK